MNLIQAVEWLKNNNVPEWQYAIKNLGGGEIHGIDHDGTFWVVYFSEKGDRRNVEKFESESLAVKKFLQLVIQDHEYYQDIKLTAP